MTLFEINQALRAYEEEFDPETGEWMNEDELNELQIAREDKLEGIGCLVKECRATSKALSDEIKNLSERKASADKRGDYFEAWLARELNNEPFATSKVSISFRRSETTDIIEERMLPKEYLIETVKAVPDKKAIKLAIKQGKDVPGATITEHYNIQVK